MTYVTPRFAAQTAQQLVRECAAHSHNAACAAARSHWRLFDDFMAQADLCAAQALAYAAYCVAARENTGWGSYAPAAIADAYAAVAYAENPTRQF